MNPDSEFVEAAQAGGQIARSSDTPDPALQEAISAAGKFKVSDEGADKAPSKEPDSDPFKVELFNPIETVSKGLISEIALRVLLLSDVQAVRLEGLKGEQEMFFYAVRSTGLSPDDIKKLAAWDYESLCRKLLAFLDSGSRPWGTRSGAET